MTVWKKKGKNEAILKLEIEKDLIQIGDVRAIFKKGKTKPWDEKSEGVDLEM